MSRRRLNWSRANSRERMRRQGYETLNGALSGGGMQQHPRTVAPPLIKAERRREAAKAFMAWRAKRGQS